MRIRLLRFSRLVVWLGLAVLLGSVASLQKAHAALGALKKTFNFTATRMVLDAPRHRIYATNSANNQLLVFDTASQTLLTPIPVGSSPYGLAISPDGSTLYVANSGSTTNAFSVIDLATMTVTKNLSAPAQPGDVVVGLNGRLYATNSSSNSTSAIMQIDPLNPANNTTFGSIYSPILALTPDLKTLIIGSRGTSNASLVRYDVSTTTASLLQQSTFSTLGSYGQEIVLTHSGNALVYLTSTGQTSGQSNYNVALIPSSDITAVIGTFILGNFPRSAAFSPDDQFTYVARTGTAQLRTFDTATFTNLGAVTLPEDFSSATGTAPVVVDETGDTLYVGTTAHIYLYPTQRPPLITSALTATADQNVAFNYQIVATHTPTSYTTSNLPTGLAVDIKTGAISGAPEHAGTFAATISATDANGTTSRTLTFTVRAPLTVSISGSGSVTAGLLGTTYHTLAEVISLTATPDADQRFVNWTGAVSSTDNPLSLSVTDGGTSIQANFLPIPPLITSELTLTVALNSTVNYQITASKPTTSYSASGLPPGLSIDTETGLISGTANTGGFYGASITATNGGGSDTQTLTFTVQTPLSFSISGQGTVTPDPGALTYHTVGEQISLTATGATGYVFAGWLGDLPESSPTLAFNVDGSLNVQATFLPLPFLAGKYYGKSKAASPQSASNELLSITFDDEGQFTALAKTKSGARSKFSGALNAQGNAVDLEDGTALNLQISQIHGGLEVLGTLTIDGTEVPISLRRSSLGAKTRTDLHGSYTLALPSPSPGNSTIPPSSNLKLKIAKTGLVQLIGKLSDGSKVAASTRLRDDLSLVVFQPLYGGRGLLSGELLYDPMTGLFSGELNWVKPADVPAKFGKKYPAGFDSTIQAATLP